MYETYNKLLEIKKSCRFDHFVMALSYFFDIGYAQAKGITDKDIKNVEGNGILSKSFNEWLMTTARQIAEATDSAVAVVQFCMAEDVFDTKMFAGKLGRDDMEQMLDSRISYEKKSPEEDATEFFETYYGCDMENFRMLGYKILEEE